MSQPDAWRRSLSSSLDDHTTYVLPLQGLCFKVRLVEIGPGERRDKTLSGEMSYKLKTASSSVLLRGLVFTLARF